MRNVERGVRNNKVNRCKTMLLVVAIFFFCAAGAVHAENNDFQFKKQAEIQQVRPPKPVKIKVHRNSKGEYSWELNGDNADEIAVVDKKLRKSLKAN